MAHSNRDKLDPLLQIRAACGEVAGAPGRLSVTFVKTDLYPQVGGGEG